MTDTSILEEIIASAPASVERGQSLSDMTVAELKTEAKKVTGEREVLAKQAADPKRNGQLAAKTTRLKAIVAEAQTRLAKNGKSE